ncbi:inactive rhomboid protein 1-like isoform X2 [Haliotis rufescens]|uniref:inactive rhomboid protein 1-like isoform X2 n=1 Tax=Haliotis rufescens TaxID=6454 RepID=UPI001EB039B8|nr:inactive rhomboid protein 1-like isoform X2 [Haliotis rufescens]
MWEKSKSAGSFFLQPVRPFFWAADDRELKSWKSHFERRIQTGDFGITLQAVLPSILAPTSFQRDKLVKQVETVLSHMSVLEPEGSSEELFRCSTVGLIGQHLHDLRKNSFETPKTSSDVKRSTLSLEEFVMCEMQVADMDIFLDALDLGLSDTDLKEDGFEQISIEETVDDMPRFVSPEEHPAKDIQKWRGEVHPSNQPNDVMTAQPDVKYEGAADDHHVKPPNNFQNNTIQIPDSLGKNQDDSVGENSQQDTNNSGGDKHSWFRNKVGPIPSNQNNHAADSPSKNSGEKKILGMTNMAYQTSGLSLGFAESAKRLIRGVLTNSAEKIEYATELTRLEQVKEQTVSEYKWKIRTVEEVGEVAKAYYHDPAGRGRRRWNELRREIAQHSKHSITDTRAKLATLTHYKPIFTYAVMMLQVLVLVVMISLNGMATVDAASGLHLQDNTRTFLGVETVDSRQQVNMWVGPSSSFFIGMGALLSVCMRDDHNLHMQGIAQNYSADNALGCCEVKTRNTAATTTQEECQSLTLGVGLWREVPCGQRQPGENYVEHVLKPCCTDERGTCLLLSNEHCSFLGGIFHEKEKEHCSQVNCPSEICQMGGMSSNIHKPWLPSSFQWWRPLLSLVYTHGVVHLLLLLVAEWLLLRQVEMSAGCLRVAVIYFICGAAGGMCASVVSPYSPQVCTTAAVMSSLGVLHMELIEAWTLLTRPWLELVKIYGLLALALITGTLPLISNFAIITGFLTGHLSAVAFLPYINLRLWTKRTRVAAVFVSLALIFLLYFIIIYSFHHLQNLYTCEWCRNFECVEYAPHMCTQP